MKESHTGIGICRCYQCRMRKKNCSTSGRKSLKRAINKQAIEVRQSNQAQSLRRILGLRLIHAFIRPTLHRNTFFSFFHLPLQGHGWTADKKFQIKIPHDVGAQDIFIWNSVAVLDWRAAVPYLCRRKEEKYAVKQQTYHLSLPVTL